MQYLPTIHCPNETKITDKIFIMCFATNSHVRNILILKKILKVCIPINTYFHMVLNYKYYWQMHTNRRFATQTGAKPIAMSTSSTMSRWAHRAVAAGWPLFRFCPIIWWLARSASSTLPDHTPTARVCLHTRLLHPTGQLHVIDSSWAFTTHADIRSR